MAIRYLRVVSTITLAGLFISLLVADAQMAKASPLSPSEAERAVQRESQDGSDIAATAGTQAGRTDPLRVGPVALGLLIGLVTVALQLWLKFTSREPPTGKRHGLVREDLVWWIEWVVAAVVAFTVLAMATAGGGGAMSQIQVVALVIVFLVGFSGLPGFVRAFGYDKTCDPPVVNRVMGIFVPNLLGAVILMVAIVSGASLAG